MLIKRHGVLLNFKFGFGEVVFNFMLKCHDNKELCISMLQNLLIPLSENIIYAQIYTNNTLTGKKFMGNNFCDKDAVCLTNVTIEESYEICSQCVDKTTCSIVIRF